jgi:5-(carboxyamino)imidazole ribonucleotide mutase
LRVKLKVAVLMGSDSDLPVMQKAFDQLKALGIQFEARIMSAHRTPADVAKFATQAAEGGFGVIIAAAGMAAHLAGVVAGHTILPVIGVPCRGGAADGLDALLSTVQMPSGIPVATVAIGGAANAAILAAQILALSDSELAEKLRAQRADMAKTIAKKDEVLQKSLIGEK